MNLLRQLFRDERGYILSAEAVLLATIGVAGATVGLGAVSKSLNDELVDVAHAFRSLDQSYCIEGETGCRSWTAGSCFKQQDVEISRAELGEWVDAQEENASETRSGSEDVKPKAPKKSTPERRLSPKRRRVQESQMRKKKSQRQNKTSDRDAESGTQESDRPKQTPRKRPKIREES